MLLGEKIKKSIDKSGLDPNQVAAFINMSTANLYRIFKRDSVETKYLMKLGELLGVSPSFFLDSEDTTFDELRSSSMSKNMLNDRIAGYGTFGQKADNNRHELEKANMRIEALEQRLRDKDEIISLLRPSK
ncbi:MAG: helix-turn-helix transcriptional regulator [Bacteroidota bacterium]